MLKLCTKEGIVSEILGLICLEDGRPDFEEVEETEIDMESAQILLALE